MLNLIFNGSNWFINEKMIVNKVQFAPKKKGAH